MGLNPTMVNFDGQNLFKVSVGQSLTVPDTIEVQSPTGRSSGVYPTNTFNSMRPVSGGLIVTPFSDVAGPSQDEFTWRVGKGDVIAVSTIGATVAGKADVSVNGTLVYRITATAVCGVIGCYA